MPRLDINSSLIGYMGGDGRALAALGSAANTFADDSMVANARRAKIKLEQDAQNSLDAHRGAEIKLKGDEVGISKDRTQIMRDELEYKKNMPGKEPALHGVKFDSGGNAIGIFSDGRTTNLGFKGKESDGGASAFANFLAKKEWMDANTPRKTVGELVGSPLSGKDVGTIQQMRDGDTGEMYGKKFIKSKGGYLPLN